MNNTASKGNQHKLKIHQIFYDDLTKSKLDLGFIPLDNTKNERPDWFEFWPIRNYLNKNELEDDTWYGFLSPRFQEKMGIDSRYIKNMIDEHGHTADAFLISPAWDQICFFQNPWEQGEVWHPGLITEGQKFFDLISYPVDLRAMVSDLTNTVFSNYIIAKKSFWIEWKRIANLFWDYAETSDEESNVRRSTSYGNKKNQYPIKTFIQERFSTTILSSNKFRCLAVDLGLNATIFTRLFPNTVEIKKLLITCDALKRLYRLELDNQYLEFYKKVKSKILYIK